MQEPFRHSLIAWCALDRIYCLPLKQFSSRKVLFDMSKPVPITVAHGDGIGPEIMAATLHILKEAGANLEIETIDIGEKVYLAGNTSGYRAQRLGFPAPHESFS